MEILVSDEECFVHDVKPNWKPVYKYWVAQSGMEGTVQILQSDNIPPIPWIKATQYLFYIYNVSYVKLVRYTMVWGLIGDINYLPEVFDKLFPKVYFQQHFVFLKNTNTF